MPSFTVRTSDSDPIFVDEIPLADSPGTLGLTLGPGKQDPEALGYGIWKRDLDKDLTRLRETFGTDVLVSLMEDWEMAELRMADLPRRADELGILVRRFSIVDVSTPRKNEALAFDELIDAIADDLASGRNVAVHCRAGLGRSGLVAACVLVRDGTPPEDAIRHVRAHRFGAIQTRGQESYVHTYSVRIAGKSDRSPGDRRS